jgi:membrane protein implicated in regulation of membrane protease activity
MNARPTTFLPVVPLVASAVFLFALGVHGLLAAASTLPLLGLAVLGVGLLRAAVAHRNGATREPTLAESTLVGCRGVVNSR